MQEQAHDLSFLPFFFSEKYPYIGFRFYLKTNKYAFYFLLSTYINY